jgi:hypothetical protein
MVCQCRVVTLTRCAFRLGLPQRQNSRLPFAKDELVGVVAGGPFRLNIHSCFLSAITAYPVGLRRDPQAHLNANLAENCFDR